MCRGHRCPILTAVILRDFDKPGALPRSDQTTMPCACHRDDCILCEGRIFNGLPADQVCQVRGLIAPISYPARAMLFHERVSADLLFILKTGCVKLTTALADGREQILRLPLPGADVGFEYNPQ